MDLEKNWPEILSVLGSAKKANRFFSVATVDSAGNPHITPIGHVFFRNDMTAYYFDAYSKAMPKNFEHNKRVCLMGVNSSTGFWFKSLFNGKFNSAPAVRLFGEVGEIRDASADEIETLQATIRITKKLKGHKLLWGNLNRVRDIKFDSFAPATYPAMCDGLWQ
ncbi:MAG: pyridoxamine 5'-phosphate oxidase family protein [Zhongshania sp.]|uniref:pyridoxamine 5'-phosphate oxidase family protein n=1 Tax=Zhongshania sp. TaxID=1971902 RepID=UPI0026301760|nr:pyridoxamine 5'-phosphate oxidase family protein [Zhongshania sp.]MDF1692138.1 pyridoxamine 5'-phosphate oxidase family protein [Zhongshania sp.]